MMNNLGESKNMSSLAIQVEANNSARSVEKQRDDALSG
jgi:hypothetical protein